MKVKELIAELEQQDPEAEVHFNYQYGDYWRTIVAPAVDTVTEGYVIDSAYHNMPKVVDEDDLDEKDSDKVSEVVLLG